jgi:hypothetical protein
MHIIGFWCDHCLHVHKAPEVLKATIAGGFFHS